ncbi:unnamed protein product [Cylindrotheca closterium]|uniref:Uncharacterized protein n=1 Tax=Cylindrotheca closterium TaxID=2856 RepID=A0AAD2FPA8_9STRA|nr:unnamed protein product [Cylindrotheca closterium]
MPKKAVTPMTSDYISELDGSPKLNAKDHTYYQELIGILRWATEIGRVDILLEILLLSQYQATPREGHMEQLLRIFAYLDTYPKLTLYFDWRLPNVIESRLPNPLLRRERRDAGKYATTKRETKWKFGLGRCASRSK